VGGVEGDRRLLDGGGNACAAQP